MTERVIGLVLVALTAGACAGGGSAPTGEVAPRGSDPAANAPAPSPAISAAAARADSLRGSYTQADVDFMTDMIHHHAQALVMTRMAPAQGASASLQVLAARITNAQNDEIALMRQWLTERGLEAPDPAHAMHGAHHAVHMPGMLSATQLERLAAARAEEFDRLFLSYMIQHHQGALTMVNELFATHGAAQGDAIFKLASDIGADQNTEIERMRLMLRDLLFETPGGSR